MNNPAILDVALAFIPHKHPAANKAQAIRELSDNELSALLNELVAQQDNCPQTIDGWKEWLQEEIK
jgi:hypothetical protein